MWVMSRSCSPFTCCTIICFSSAIVICFQYTTNLQPIKLLLHISCHNVLSILQYISVWCLVSSFLLVQSSILEGSFMCRAVYCHINVCCTWSKSNASSIMQQRGVYFFGAHWCGVFCHWFFFLHFSNRAASWDNHKLHSIFNDLHLLINLLAIHIKLLLICCTWSKSTCCISYIDS